MEEGVGITIAMDGTEGISGAMEWLLPILEAVTITNC
jgi:hypothetical protein